MLYVPGYISISYLFLDPRQHTYIKTLPVDIIAVYHKATTPIHSNLHDLNSQQKLPCTDTSIVDVETRRCDKSRRLKLELNSAWQCPLKSALLSDLVSTAVAKSWITGRFREKIVVIYAIVRFLCQI